MAVATRAGRGGRNPRPSSACGDESTTRASLDRRRSRRDASWMLLLGSAAMCGGSASASEGSVSPYKRGMSEMEYGPIRDGKVRGCPTVNPNCVSTSSLNPRTYASPWTTPADVKDLSEAKAVLVDLMLSPSGFGCKLLEEQSSDPPGQWEYVRLSTPSGRFGEDQMEFVLTRKTLDRNW